MNASTGPCLGGHGDGFHLFNMGFDFFASTGPCLGGHGDQNLPPGEPTIPMLQRGRALEGTEIAIPAVDPRPQQAALQRGRALEGTEMELPASFMIACAQASTGPCLGGHGDLQRFPEFRRRLWIASTGPCLGGHGDLEMGCWVGGIPRASTGPCLGGHGDQVASPLH